MNGSLHASHIRRTVSFQFYFNNSLAEKFVETAISGAMACHVFHNNNIKVENTNIVASYSVNAATIVGFKKPPLISLMINKVSSYNNVVVCQQSYSVDKKKTYPAYHVQRIIYWKQCQDGRSNITI